MYNVDVIKEGYSRLLDDGHTMVANGTCTLVQGSGINLLVDTLTGWDKNFLIAGLRQRNLNCDDINYVVCTHGHSDHVGNLNLFVKALHIVGWSIAREDTYTLHPFDKGVSYEISEGIEVVPTPGHTLSDVSVVVKLTPLGTVVISGDLFEREEDITNPDLWKTIAGSENELLQLKNRQKMLDIADYIVPGHGPMFQVTDGLRKKHC